jgi:GNAT superfamily N-acetyltransferase
MVVDVDYCVLCQGRAEQVVHRCDGTPVPEQAYTWPDSSEFSALGTRAPLVATLDGICAGRCFLEIEHYPFAELQNLVVAPQFRGRGVGDAIVGDTIRRASRLGYPAIHLQVNRDNVVAHTLYSRHGFLPAQQGEQQMKMIRFLDYPALALFLRRHPLALLSSRRDHATALWEMKWEDAAGSDSLSILLSGGSCQGDSDGFGPGVGAFELRCGGVQFRAEMPGQNSVSRSAEFGIDVKIENHGLSDIEGSCRLLLNHGFAPGAGTKGCAPIRLAPQSSDNVALPVVVTELFDGDFWKHSCFSSVPICAEVAIGEHVFWLAEQVKL